MNILGLYPGMTPAKNENASILTELQKRGAKIVVITSCALHLKGAGKMPPYENMEGVQIYRFYRSPLEMFVFPEKNMKKIIKAISNSEPDIILCSQELNIRLALLLQRRLKKPIVLVVEDATSIYLGNFYKKIKERLMLGLFGIPSGLSFWPWLVRCSSGIIACHPKDRQFLGRLAPKGKPMLYAPWPTNIPQNFIYPPSKNKNRGVYVGSLYPFKNTQEFERILPLIIEKTPTKEFIVVGPGPHEQIVRNLQKRTNNQIKYVQQLSRVDALQLIASSFYAYTPVMKGGWGFIGDCWSMKTPIIMTHNEEGYVVNNSNALVSDSDESLIRNINKIYNDQELYIQLQNNGYREAIMKQPSNIANKFHSIFAEVLKNKVQSN